ncbi:MAG: DNA polymerase/3'-5' exonuclease PolX [Planctomycetes bacterium]|nr:DNA polymerase/3'-5' exonuclease PolX [Planctomycetota bacterium]
MALLNAQAVADLLDEIGERLELTGETAFKVRAYHGAAEVLRELREPLEEVVAARRLLKLPGIGEAIAEKISSLHKKGTHPTLERLREEVPDGLLQIMRIPGLGPKKVLQLRDVLGIEDLDALERAAQSDKLVTLKGFTAKTQAKILESIDFVRSSAKRVLLVEADYRVAEQIRSLMDHPACAVVQEAGETRRRCETVAAPAVVAAFKPGQEAGLPEAPEEIRAQVRRVTCPQDRFGAVIYWETGAPEHVAQVCKLAEKKGLRFEAGGLFKKNELVQTPREQDFAAALGIALVPPELREGEDELELASKGKLPRLIEDGDIKGILHSHTTYSDGQASLEAMCEAVRALGLGYYGVCDHSQTAAYARGLKEDRIRAQHAEIEALNARYKDQGFRVFKGIESDIREDGALDYPDEVLERFDFVVASVHGRFDLDEKAQTQRIVKAVSNPFTTILGHMTGRLLLRRAGYHVDVPRVLEACAGNGVAVEINAHPVRLDVDWRWHRKGKELGCRFSIDPDAHTIPELEHVRYGVAVARKGGLTAADNLTSLNAVELDAYFKARRSRR